MPLALSPSMSSLDVLHQAAPSLGQRRTHSQDAVVKRRRSLAMRTPSQEQAAVADPLVESAEIFYDPTLTVEAETKTPKRAKLVGAVVFGVSCGAAIASMVFA